MNAVNAIGHLLKDTAMKTQDRNSIGCAKFVVFCNAVEDNPFMAGAFHGVGEGDAAVNVGVSGPGVIKRALERVRGADFETLCETVKRTAFKITRVGQLVAQEAARRLNVPFGVIDLSLAPTPAIGDSIAEILQEMGLEQPGAPGTTAVRIIPVIGKKVGDVVEFGGLLGSAPVMEVNRFGCANFVQRGGRIPAPIHSFRN
jgi:uncharacterized protein (UPF0210 family)